MSSTRRPLALRTYRCECGRTFQTTKYPVNTNPIKRGCLESRQVRHSQRGSYPVWPEGHQRAVYVGSNASAILVAMAKRK